MNAKKLKFLKSILREKDRHKRMEKLLHADKEDINAVSDLSLNFLKQNIPVSQPVVKGLKRHKNDIRELGRRKTSLKRRREILMNQKGTGFWRGMNNVLCSCYKKR